jgi:GNAT superfamily N-acetyltransferase
MRPATGRDATILADLTTQLGYPTDAGAMRRRLARLDGRSDHLILVAVDASDEPIGWIHVARQPLLHHHDLACIEGLVVGEGHRGAGIGQALVEAGEAWAREHGATEIMVRTRSTRERAHRFYQRIGYVETKRSHVFARPLV